ncbi:MAG TPA: hypothetical protein VNR51_09745 [Hyphomicrobium sp.]|nr:hypothetical protein [Hyphomicrobium sp.]
MARKPISVAAKIFAAVALLGPPIGGFAFMALVELFRWSSDLGAGSPPRSILDVGKAMLGWIQISYVAGGQAALLAGAGLAAWVAWGGRFTLWACLAAAEIYALMLVAMALIEPDPHGRSVVLLQAALTGVFSAIAGLGCYLLLRKTALVRGINTPASDAPGDVT